MALDWLLELKFFYFQESSIIPIINNLNLWVILVLFGLVFINRFVLQFDKLNQFVNIILIPFVAIGSYLLFNYLSAYIGFQVVELYITSFFALFKEFLIIWPILIGGYLIWLLVWPINKIIAKITNKNRYVDLDSS